jgi:hypothetical protein
LGIAVAGCERALTDVSGSALGVCTELVCGCGSGMGWTVVSAGSPKHCQLKVKGKMNFIKIKGWTGKRVIIVIFSIIFFLPD